MSRLGGIDQRCTAAALPLQKRYELMDHLQGPHPHRKAREHGVLREQGSTVTLESSSGADFCSQKQIKILLLLLFHVHVFITNVFGARSRKVG